MADQFKRLADGVADDEVTRAKNAVKGVLLGYQDSHDGLQNIFSEVGRCQCDVPRYIEWTKSTLPHTSPIVDPFSCNKLSVCNMVQVALSGTAGPNTISDVFSQVSRVTAADVQTFAANAIKENPSLASVGDIADVPRYDAVASLF